MGKKLPPFVAYGRCENGEESWVLSIRF